jgi:hypothetical protein
MNDLSELSDLHIFCYLIREFLPAVLLSCVAPGEILSKIKLVLTGHKLIKVKMFKNL